MFSAIDLIRTNISPLVIANLLDFKASHSLLVALMVEYGITKNDHIRVKIERLLTLLGLFEAVKCLKAHKLYAYIEAIEEVGV